MFNSLVSFPKHLNQTNASNFTCSYVVVVTIPIFNLLSMKRLQDGIGLKTTSILSRSENVKLLMSLLLLFFTSLTKPVSI